MLSAATDDAELVNATMAGNRDAFGEIVARYQSLICSLAYSATGSLGQSEDLAQETFIIAWKHLGHLRERAKLRSWLCGIARNRINNFLRREGRNPIRASEPLEELAASASPEPLPHDHAITREEEAILWRALESIPNTYREPLVLYYREHKSIETVAANLDLTEDAVTQRLSRGRKMLQEQIVAFVEGALKRTNPGPAFTGSVLAALPATMKLSAKAVTLGAAAKGASAKAAGAGLIGVLLGPLMVFFGNYLGYRIGMAEARSDEERRHIRSFYSKACIAAFGISTICGAAIFWATRGQFSGWNLFSLLFVIFTVGYLLSIFFLVFVTSKQRHRYYARMLDEQFGGIYPPPSWEYCSRMKFLGLPLIHIRIGDRFDFMRRPVTGWIAAGNYAKGGLFAFGAVAIAPICIGGFVVGIIPFGGLALGLLPLGGLTLGMWAFGGIAAGWHAFGCVAVAWDTAVGNFALAHHFALGDIARASEINTTAVRQFVDGNLFFRCIRFVNRHWVWMNVLWITSLFLQWQVLARKNRHFSHL